MPTETCDRPSRWSTLGIVELHKELEHLRRAVPASPAIPDLERYLAERVAEAERVYCGRRADRR